MKNQEALEDVTERELCSHIPRRLIWKQTPPLLLETYKIVKNRLNITNYYYKNLKPTTNILMQYVNSYTKSK